MNEDTYHAMDAVAATLTPKGVSKIQGTIAEYERDGRYAYILRGVLHRYMSINERA